MKGIGIKVDMLDRQNNNPALQLAQYLKEFVGLRTTIVRDIAKYDSVLWFGDMLQDKDCCSPAWLDGCEADTPWLEVKKQQFIAMPAVPERLLSWLDSSVLARANEQMPGLKRSILLSDEKSEPIEGESAPLIEMHLVDYPEIEKSYDRYRVRWQAWADEHMRRQKIQDLYARLFALHTQLHKQSELLELALGFGLLDWRAPIGGHIRRHLITARVELIFEPKSGVMRLAAPGDGARLRIEDDMLEAELRPDRSQYESIEKQLDNICDEIWDKPQMHTALKQWAVVLGAGSIWSESLNIHTADPKNPVVSFAPALILRKRAQIGMVRIYDAIADQLAGESHQVPVGWSGLVDDIEDVAVNGRTDDGESKSVGYQAAKEEIYFPLPANKEQRRIVEAIDRHRGVLVQGPPGTGKSHTIANLICHLLATGKRVLITAETSRALMVLKDKLPKEIQPLCVSLLGQGGDAFAELNMAVQGITVRQSHYTPGKYEPRIADIDIDIDTARRNLAETDNELRGLREEETCPHQIGNGIYNGTASAIAKRVSSERAEYGWLELPYSAPTQSPCSNKELIKWLEICSLYSTAQVDESQLKIPSSDSLVTPQEFSTLIAKESDLRESLERFNAARKHPAYKSLRSILPEQQVALVDVLQRLEKQRLLAMRTTSEWQMAALGDLIAGKRVRWITVLNRSKELLVEAASLDLSLGKKTVSIADNCSRIKMLADAKVASEFLNGGGKWKRMGVLTPTILKDKTYLKSDVLVDGVGAQTPEQLNVLCDELSLNFILEELLSVWADLGVKITSSNRQLLIADLQELQVTLARSISYANACLDVYHSLSSFSAALPEPSWLNGEVAHWVSLLQIAEKETSYNTALHAVKKCVAGLGHITGLHSAHLLVADMVVAIEQRNINDYSRLYDNLIVLEKTRSAQSFRTAIEKRISPYLQQHIEDITEGLSEVDWSKRLSTWVAAWDWAIANNWFSKRKNILYQQELLKKRELIDSKINELIAESAGLRAWTYFFKRLSIRQSAALKSWSEAVKAMGKGTGKSAKMARLRAEARENMDVCRDAIPIWVMPRYLVAEMIDPAPGRYDIVIVDEASQLGIESLFLFYIAKKMVVVGDDQQISPYGIGISDEAVAGLQEHYLKGMSYRHALSPQSSLYGNAKIRFSQNVVLREHFRCMPEIIQFSNDLCYANNGTPLDPLRAYPVNRLQPLVLRHVADGYRTGGSTNAKNDPEADAIVAQIAGCIADPRYKDKTIGVISLQGDTQAKLIEKKLLETLEPEVIEERGLICGDAYAFQGDERHIIFLSMVAAPGEIRMSALTNDSARQRFNVAVSRAQDQLWLFHTATLEELSPECMRYRLLKYMLEPKRESTIEEDQKFDSKFEREVYLHITQRGFHVRTQVAVGDPTNHRYRLDLVVEGMQGRLVVECDGDKWHGPERYEHDMARQRDLERSGWQFARIRGSEFYRDPESAMLPIWSELERLGIQPGGVDSTAAAPPAPFSSNQPEKLMHITSSADNHPVIVTDEQPIDIAELKHKPIDGDQLQIEIFPANDFELIAATGSVEKAKSCTVNTKVQPSAKNNTQKAYTEFNGAISTGLFSTGLDPEEISKGLVQIINIEAPMLAKRAYGIYLRNCGVQRMDGELRKIMNKALQDLISSGRVVKEDERGKGGLIYTIIRPAGSPSVVVRSRGTREFSEIPPSEILAVAQKTASNMGFEKGSDEHLRAILEHYDIEKLTTRGNTELMSILSREY